MKEKEEENIRDLVAFKSNHRVEVDGVLVKCGLIAKPVMEYCAVQWKPNNISAMCNGR